MDNIAWNKSSYNDFLNYLHSLSDSDYKDFNNKITPFSQSDIIGIRVPKMREISKEISKGNFREFLEYINTLDKTKLSHEEISIYGLVIGYAKLPFGELCERIRTYASLVNNWACCDCPVSSFKEIKKYLEEYKIEIYRFLKSKNPWEQRVGIIILLDYYLNTAEMARYALTMINDVKSNEYYVMMAQAWLIATSLAKQRDITHGYLVNDFDLNDDVKKMTIRKVRDSFRISEEDKNFILTI